MKCLIAFLSLLLSYYYLLMSANRLDCCRNVSANVLQPFGVHSIVCRIDCLLLVHKIMRRFDKKQPVMLRCTNFKNFCQIFYTIVGCWFILIKFDNDNQSKNSKLHTCGILYRWNLRVVSLRKTDFSQIQLISCCKS